MQLRTFTASNMHEALAKVRTEMGVDAVIVSSQRAKGGGVMVRAAVEAVPVDVELEAAMAVLAEAAETEAAHGDDFAHYYHQVLIRRLRAPAPEAPTIPARNFNRAELLGLLRGHRAPDRLSHALAEAAEKSDMTDMTLALASALDGRMKTAPIEPSRSTALLLAGPHGSGKTVVAAKLAAQARQVGREVSLIAADAKGAGAVARLKTFAEHLQTHFAVADSAEDLAKCVSECIKTKRLAIIDSAGFDPLSGKARSAFAALAKIDGVEAIGVVSANRDAEDMTETVAALTALGAGRLIVTGLDLARRLGALAAAATSARGLAHIARSPFVGSGLETLTPLSLARSLIETGTGHSGQGTEP